VISGGKCDDSVSPLVVGKLQESVCRPPQFERVPGLKAFAFQPDSSLGDLAFDQRRTLDKAGNSLGRGDQILSGDQLLIC
jgi:hypothetical protein